MTSSAAELDSAVAALRDLILAGERFRHAVADRFCVGVTETMVLSHLSAAGGQLTPREIGERMTTTSGTLSAILDRLEAVQMVSRSPNPDDRRSVLITLVPPGRRALAYARARMVDAVGGVLDFSPDRVDALARLADQLSRQADEVRSDAD